MNTTNAMIDKMNAEKELHGKLIEIVGFNMAAELAEIKVNEIMRLTGHSYYNFSSDDACPYCNKLSDENGYCDCPGSWPHCIEPKNI